MENDVMDAVQRVADGILALEAELWAAAVANPAPAFTIVAAFIGVVGVTTRFGQNCTLSQITSLD